MTTEEEADLVQSVADVVTSSADRMYNSLGAAFLKLTDALIHRKIEPTIAAEIAGRVLAGRAQESVAALRAGLK